MRRLADWFSSFLILFLLISAATGLIELVVGLFVTGEDVTARVQIRRLGILGLVSAAVLLVGLMVRLLAVHVTAPGAVQDPVELLRAPTGSRGNLRARVGRMLEPWSPHTSVWTRAIWWAVSLAALGTVLVNLVPVLPPEYRAGVDTLINLAIAVAASLGAIREGRAADFQRRDTLGRLVKQALSSVESQARSTLRELYPGPVFVRCYIMQPENEHLRITWATRRVTAEGRMFRVRSDRGVWGEAWNSNDSVRGNPWRDLRSQEDEFLPRNLRYVWAAPIINEGADDDPKRVGILVVDTSVDIQLRAPVQSDPDDSEEAGDGVDLIVCFHAEQMSEYLALLD